MSKKELFFVVLVFLIISSATWYLVSVEEEKYSREMDSLRKQFIDMHKREDDGSTRQSHWGPIQAGDQSAIVDDGAPGDGEEEFLERALPYMEKDAKFFPFASTQTIKVSKVNKRPIIDGFANEDAWKNSEKGNGPYPGYSMKAVHDDVNIYFLFEIDDERERLPDHVMRWVAYNPTPQRPVYGFYEEDKIGEFRDLARLVFFWGNDGGEYFKGNRKDDYYGDCWIWNAIGSSGGYCEDYSVHMSLEDNMGIMARLGEGFYRFFNIMPDNGVFPSRKVDNIVKAEDVMFQLIPTKPTKSCTDIRVAATREHLGKIYDKAPYGYNPGNPKPSKGKWVIEMERKLDTGNADDIAFARGKKNYMIWGFGQEEDGATLVDRSFDLKLNTLIFLDIE